MKQKSVSLLFVLPLLVFITFGCSTDSGSTIQEPTFDNVEDEMLSIEGIESEPVEDGIVKYVVEEGTGEFQVVNRDNVMLFITVTTQDEGTFIYSTYQNNNTSPVGISVAGVHPYDQPTFNVQRAYSNGLRKGLIGMKEGEERVLIVPPSEGFENIPGGTLNEAYRNNTLRYDIELEEIL